MHDPETNMRKTCMIRIELNKLVAVPGSIFPYVYAAEAFGISLAIFRLDERHFAAVERRCPHKKADLVRFGFVVDDGKSLLCAAHAHRYDLGSGECQREDACADASIYPTRLSSDRQAIEITIGTTIQCEIEE